MGGGAIDETFHRNYHIGKIRPLAGSLLPLPKATEQDSSSLLLGEKVGEGFAPLREATVYTHPCSFV